MTDRFSLDGKIAVVTGGSRGIGKGIAVGFAEHGADVAIVYRSAQKEAEAVAERIRGLGRRCWVFRRDLGEVETLSDFVDDIWRTTGRVDVLVNNAGMAYLERFNEITAAHWRRLMAVNLALPAFEQVMKC
ncbi:MAG TPA: SDR family NAD(P)-dependent oxidoreductase, partial [Candidatus Latescibacteria bacterium]|nr:SDR family NAD(P)-dependent oxidoreductase [Candidatus Latescibacterota bacterium]